MILLFTVGISTAEIYKWIDENGVVHYSDSPSQMIPETAEDKEIQSPEPAPPDERPSPDEARTGSPDPNSFNFLDETQENAVAANTPSVEIYETAWCGYCKKAKNFFRSKGIDFVAYDIEKDPQAARRMMKMTHRRAVPFVVINGQGISGYSVEAYEMALQN